MNEERVRAEFHSRFGRSPLLFSAPGRINLIGEHTDYNDGFVMPAAIDRQIVIAMAPNGTDQFSIFSWDFKEEMAFSLQDLVPGQSWVNYLMGVVHGIHKVGFPLRGVDCLISGNIPSGAGLSSSAALCCGFGIALSETLDLNVSRLGIAKVAQYAENHFAGVNCGLMDQLACLFGKKESVMLLDCRSLEYKHLPFQFPGYEILLIDTKVKHSLAATAYNSRREACEEGVRCLNKNFSTVKSLRDATAGQLLELKETMNPDIYKKCSYVVKEIERTRAASGFLIEGNLHAFGKLMFDTHWGLSRDYVVSCEELDTLVRVAAENTDFVAGSRMMGGGFGGCTINLVKSEYTERFSSCVCEKYVATFKKEPDFYRVELSDGVHRIRT